MKTLTTMIAVTSIACTARASGTVPYIAMPIDHGYAIDAHGKRQPSALCARDVIWACGPRYPVRDLTTGPSSDAQKRGHDGLYRLDINLKTDRVHQITIIKSEGSILDRASVTAISRSVFTRGTWSAMIIP